MTNIPCCPVPLSPTANTEGWAYLEAMYHLCQIISQRLNPDAAANASYVQILDNCQVVESIRDKLMLQLRSKEACKSALDRLQHFAIRLHTSFIVSVCCRPALMRRENSRLDSTQRKFLADKCKQNLTETVRMFLAMHQLSVIPTRSWAFTYHGLSSAVLLGILGETKADPEVRQLQGDLISALSATAAKEQTSPQPHIRRSEHDIELSGPLSRALTALKNIYDHGSVVGPPIKREGSISVPGSGTRTPLQHAHIGPSGFANSVSAAHDSRNNIAQPTLDPHQNAALAMAELQMQSSGSAADFSAGYAFPASLRETMRMLEAANLPDDLPHRIPFAQMPPQQQVPDMANFDPTSYMSPMDLYDSIFWGENKPLPLSNTACRRANRFPEAPDPFNTGMDSMNFDFLAHPPPGQPPQQQFYF